ncbi:uncharacterized protein LOC117904460 [Vitis riparia]|uniref:Uncharacterized protein n=1 Tax=Vitis vinifera TaxID=29760 RepID=A0A438EYM3_VITVI|nr:uncharacterized protein LOC117904460 [Vitis riparia]RVW52851.1 hypothetical protein CK203_076580 [Vitis vinifera]
MPTEDSNMAHKEVEAQAEAESPMDATTGLFSSRSCCFCIPCFGSHRSSTVGLAWWEKMRTAQNEDTWWGRSLRSFKKVREWSELAAGPRWKTFIRRFNKTRSGGARHGKFQYDPLSYSLNFDEGAGHNGSSDDDRGYEFTARYASVSLSSKSSMEDKDAITLT